MQQQKFQLYKERTFGEKVNDTFSFLRDNWRPIAMWYVYLVLPFSLLGAVSFNSMFKALMTSRSGDSESALTQALSSNYSSILNSLLSVFSFALILTFVQFYLRRENRLEGLTFKELQNPVFANLGHLILLGFVITGLMIAYVLVMLLLGFVLSMAVHVAFVIFLAIVVTVALGVPLSLSPIVYIMERENGIGPFEAVKKGFRLGWHTWGGLFALLFVLGVIVTVLSVLLEGPAIVAWVVELFSAEKAGAHYESSVIGAFGRYLLTVIMVFGSQVLNTIFAVGLTIHYGHACEKLDGVSAEEAIETFETL